MTAETTQKLNNLNPPQHIQDAIQSLPQRWQWRAVDALEKEIQLQADSNREFNWAMTADRWRRYRQIGNKALNELSRAGLVTPGKFKHQWMSQSEKNVEVAKQIRAIHSQINSLLTLAETLHNLDKKELNQVNALKQCAENLSDYNTPN